VGKEQRTFGGRRKIPWRRDALGTLWGVALRKKEFLKGRQILNHLTVSLSKEVSRGMSKEDVHSIYGSWRGGGESALGGRQGWRCQGGVECVLKKGSCGLYPRGGRGDFSMRYSGRGER